MKSDQVVYIPIGAIDRRTVHRLKLAVNVPLAGVGVRVVDLERIGSAKVGVAIRAGSLCAK